LLGLESCNVSRFPPETLHLRMHKLIVVEGPTASGKTALAVELARHFNTVVISSDSRQCYKEMNIGTAKPNLSETKGVPHHFIDSHSIHHPLSAGQFEIEATNLLASFSSDISIVCGGSGMYTDALCIGLDPIPTIESVNLKWRKIYLEKGIDFLLNELKSKDIDFFNQVDKANSKRIIRALEVIDITGEKFSMLRQQYKQSKKMEVFRYVLNLPRELLYEQINNRVDSMMENGLLNEVVSLQEFKHLSALQTVGYRELFEYLEGKQSIHQATSLIKQHTRNYAKRQLTYFKRHNESIWIDSDCTQSRFNAILQSLPF
jgi:tRNA dimethylallyltransferase